MQYCILRLNGKPHIEDFLKHHHHLELDKLAKMSYPFLISRYTCPHTSRGDHGEEKLTFALRRTLDPIFAVSVGVAAAVVRINREEKEKGKSFEQSKESLRKRTALAWREVMGEEETVKAAS